MTGERKKTAREGEELRDRCREKKKKGKEMEREREEDEEKEIVHTVREWLTMFVCFFFLSCVHAIKISPPVSNL